MAFTRPPPKLIFAFLFDKEVTALILILTSPVAVVSENAPVNKSPVKEIPKNFSMLKVIPVKVTIKATTNKLNRIESGIFFIHLFGSSEANKLKALFFVSLNRKFMDEPYRNIK